MQPITHIDLDRLHSASVEALDDARRALGRYRSALRCVDLDSTPEYAHAGSASMQVDAALDHVVAWGDENVKAR